MKHYVLTTILSFRKGWRFRTIDEHDVSTWHLLPGLIKMLNQELSMKYTHLLELSTTEPRQYRITVIEDNRAKIIEHALDTSDNGFTSVGYYDTPEELLAVLIPYLQMEQGK